MVEYTAISDKILGRKLLCTAKDFSKPKKVSTRGRHNAQLTEACGDAKIPAFAIVDVPVSHSTIPLEKQGSLDSVKGERLICQHENHPFVNNIGNGAKQTKFNGNPAVAVIDKKLELVS